MGKCVLPTGKASLSLTFKMTKSIFDPLVSLAAFARSAKETGGDADADDVVLLSPSSRPLTCHRAELNAQILTAVR